jgi:hypothetical protein
MPARSTLFVWLRQRPDFREKYKFAKRFQIQWLADEMVDVADGRANGWIEREGPNGKTVRVRSREFSPTADSRTPEAALQAEAEEIPLVARVPRCGAATQNTSRAATTLRRRCAMLKIEFWIVRKGHDPWKMSSRRLEREAGRNVEVMWLTGRRFWNVNKLTLR